MKRLSGIALIIVLAATLGGCSKNSSEEATASAPATPAASPAASTKPASTKAAPAEPAKPVDATPKATAQKMMVIPADTEVSVLLIDSISTRKNKAGDKFMASLADPITVNGEQVVSRGTKVQGRVVDAEDSGRVKGTASIRMVLTDILDGNKSYPIVTSPFVAEAESSTGRDAGIIGGAAGVGAAIGAIAGGGKGAAKGAAIGGAAGTGTVLATKGKEVEFDSETRLKFKLEKAAELPKIGS